MPFGSHTVGTSCGIGKRSVDAIEFVRSMSFGFNVTDVITLRKLQDQQL